MDMPRQNVCPQCGHYIWAHPITQSENSTVATDICSLSTGSAQKLYEEKLREYSSGKWN